MAVRAVLDTQILVRGILRRRTSSAVAVFDLGCERSGLVVVTSPTLLRELERILKLDEIRRLANPPLDDDVIRRAVTYLAERFDVVSGTFRDVDRVPADVRDNPLVEAALEGEADAIVSDDDDLLSLKVVKVSGFRPVQILAPGPYLKLLRPGR